MDTRLTRVQSGKLATSKPSDKRLSKETFARMATVLMEIVSEANLTITPEETGLRLSKWEELIREVGEREFFKRMERWRRTEKFIPHTSDLRNMKPEEDAPIQYPEFTYFTEEEKREAREAYDSPEGVAFRKKLQEIIDGKKMPAAAKKDHAAKVRKQAEKMR